MAQCHGHCISLPRRWRIGRVVHSREWTHDENAYGMAHLFAALPRTGAVSIRLCTRCGVSKYNCVHVVVVCGRRLQVCLENTTYATCSIQSVQILIEMIYILHHSDGASVVLDISCCKTRFFAKEHPSLIHKGRKFRI